MKHFGAEEKLNFLLICLAGEGFVDVMLNDEGDVDEEEEELEDAEDAEDEEDKPEEALAR